MAVQFYEETPLTLKNRKFLKGFIKDMFAAEQQPFEALRVIFCSDAYLLSINREFLQHDYYTDIISFNLSEPSSPTVGELYISVERVRENASTLGHRFETELHRVIFHGVLHLCGYKDKTRGYFVDA
ncbi:MAG: rRNA maturation RNase YbeY [Ferruginibacter sp.]